jgi:hypothetical protein
MPSSTSSSDRPGFVRLTASNRPGVAQPVPERDIPDRPWRPIMLGALGLFVVLVGAWELYWRSYGVTPGYRNSNAEWAQQRRRIDHGDGAKTVLIGSSRVLFDVQLPVWEQITGERPIQLALEGTSPLPVLEDLADDPELTGRLLIGVAPDLFFSGFAARGDVVPYFHKEGPAQRIGNWLSRHLLEPYFAYYGSDFALATVILRQPWPVRPGTHPHTDVRKLMVQDADRNSHMWSKLTDDPEYRELARSIWAQSFRDVPHELTSADDKHKMIEEQITKAAAAVAKLRARGVRVVFVRLPSTGEFYAYEQKYLPRAETWDLLLARTGAPGIHFEDYPELQGYELPEWSHLSAPEATRFTAAFVPIVEREFRKLEH